MLQQQPASAQSGSLTFKPAPSPTGKIVYEVFVGIESIGIIIKDTQTGKWGNSRNADQHSFPYEAAAALLDADFLYLPAEATVEIGYTVNPDGKKLYHMLNDSLRLGTFYCLDDGRWIASPSPGLPIRLDRTLIHCNCAAEAQMVIVMLSGLLVA